MTPSLIFLTQALVIVSLPVLLLRVSGLRGFLPLAAVQIMLGIVLGPSVFGRVMPDFYHVFVNPVSLSALSGIGSIAVLIFALITGLHFEARIFSTHGRAFAAVAAARITIPTALGVLAGFWLLAHHPDELLPGIGATDFAAAIGICIGMTALPVLGAILREMNLLNSRIGHFAMGIAGRDGCHTLDPAGYRPHGTSWRRRQLAAAPAAAPLYAGHDQGRAPRSSRYGHGAHVRWRDRRARVGRRGRLDHCIRLRHGGDGPALCGRRLHSRRHHPRASHQTAA